MKKMEPETETFEYDDLLNAGVGGFATYLYENNLLKPLYTSESVCKLLGYSREEYEQAIDGNALNLIVDTEEREYVNAAIQEAVRKGVNLNTLFNMKHREQGEILIHVNGLFVKEEDRMLLKVLYTVVAEEAKMYKEVATHTTSGCYVVSEDFDVLFLNNKLRQILSGAIKDNVVGKKCYKESQMRESPCPTCPILTSHSTEIQSDKLGHTFKVSAQESSWYGSRAHIVYLDDITEQKKTAFEIEQIYNNIPGAVFQCKFDPDWTVLSANDGFYHFLGYTKEEFTQLGNIMSAVIYPDDQKIMAGKVRSQLVDGNKFFENENRLICKDGTVKWISIKGQLLELADGGQYFYCVFVDITREKKESARVYEDQKRYRIILEMLGIAYWEWSKEEGVYSSERYEDYAISEIGKGEQQKGFPYDSYVHPDDRVLSDAYMKLDFQGTFCKKSATLRAKMKDGTYQWTEMFSYAEKNQNGELIRIISIMRSVDKEWKKQKKQLELALKKAEAANEAKTAFLSRISHDMRTPLNGILGLTTLLKEYVADDRAVHDLSELELSGKYLLNLINDTLDVSRIESGKLELHPVVCDGQTLYNNALELTRVNMKSKHQKLVVNTGDLLFTYIYVDVARIQQIGMNVIGNAIKFSPEGATITISIRNISVKDGVITDEIVIEDNGIGMSKEFLPHIFDAFSQEDATRTSNSQGTGLGMSITKKLLEKMGGDITVESELGKGSRFTITLKMDIATDEQIEEYKKTRISSDTGIELSGRRILLCEDHPLNTNIATRMLEAKGMVVEHAGNGKIGAEMFLHSVEGYYDAILMDIRMPVMDGIEAAKAIRSLPRRDARVIPIIAMTANAFAEDVAQTKEAGMDAHLSKPIQTDLLYETLGSLLRIERSYRRKRILIVDDIEINRETLRTALEESYEIMEAENGEQALEIVEHTRGIDLVITDIQMPVMDGVELIRKIRENDSFRHIQIIANTQFGDPQQEEELLLLGANDFVYKPTTPKIVEIRVKKVLEKG